MRYASQWTNAERAAQARLRREALAEFRDGMICARCKRPMRSWQALELDHIIPRSQGGPTTKENVRLCHKRCNQLAGCVLGNRSPKRKFRTASAPRRRRLPKW